MSRSSSGATAGRRPTAAERGSSPLVAALATPPGRGALAVVRLSGDHLVPCLRRLVPRLPDPLPARRPLLVTLVDAAGEAVDRGLLTYFPGPASYTGEDMAEFSGHGNPRLVERILAAASAAGARPAEPGEFTLRAFLNGKVDLAGAEGVRELVEARSTLAARLALDRVVGRGEGGASLAPLAEGARGLLARVEASVDFAETDGTAGWEALRREMERLLRELGDRLEAAERLARKGRGARIVIAGAPNAGKSFVFNRLCGEERALVTPVAGTTRDPLREWIDRDGATFMLVDTAGVSGSEHPLERMAEERAEREIATADLVLAVVDPSAGEIAERITTGRRRLGGRPGLVVLSQCDDGLEPAEGEDWVATSAVTGFGLPRLGDRIVEEVRRLGGDEGAAGDWLGEFRRHRLAQAIAALEEARVEAGRGSGGELVAEGVRRAWRSLEAASGGDLSEEMLSELFSSFCIGK